MDSDQIEDWQGQQLFKRREAAAILGVNPATLYRRIKKGDVEVVNTAIGERITRGELRRIIKGRPVERANRRREDALALFGRPDL